MKSSDGCIYRFTVCVTHILSVVFFIARNCWRALGGFSHKEFSRVLKGSTPSVGCSNQVCPCVVGVHTKNSPIDVF